MKRDLVAQRTAREKRGETRRQGKRKHVYKSDASSSGFEKLLDSRPDDARRTLHVLFRSGRERDPEESVSGRFVDRSSPCLVREPSSDFVRRDRGREISTGKHGSGRDEDGVLGEVGPEGLEEERERQSSKRWVLAEVNPEPDCTQQGGE